MSRDEPASRIFKWALPALLILGILIRLSTWTQIYQDATKELHFFGPDSFYQLRRLVYFLENFPETLFFDPLINWPVGMSVAWSEAFTWIMGLPLWVVGATEGLAMEMGASLQMLLLGLVVIFLSYSLANERFGRPEAFLAGFLACVSLGVTKHSALGVFDHHIFEILFPGFALWLIFRKPQAKLNAIFLGGLIFASLWISVASFISLLGILALVFYRLETKSMKSSALLWIVAASLIPSVVYALWRASFDSSAFVVPRFSMLHVLVLCGLWVPLILRGFIYSRRFYWSAALGMCVLGGASLFIFELWGLGVKQALLYVMGGSGSLALISEAQAVWNQHGAWDYQFIPAHFGYLLPLLLIPFFHLNSIKKWPWEFLIPFLVMLPICLLQKRFSHLILIPYFLVLVWCTRLLINSLRVSVRRLSYALIVFGACVPMLVFSPTPPIEARHVLELSLLAKLRHHMDFMDKASVRNALTSSEPLRGGIYAEPNMGSFLLYRTGRGVLIHSYFPTRALRADLSYRLQKSPEEYFEALQSDAFEWVLVQDDYLYFQGLHKILEKDFSAYGRTVDGKDLVLKGEVMQTLGWVQLLMNAAPRGATFLEALEFQIKYPYNKILLFRL